VKQRIVLVVGARPNFVKAAALLAAFSRQRDLETVLVHTGQHYDESMSGAFLRSLKLPRPDFYLGVGSGGHAPQTARVLARLEAVLKQYPADRLVVVGDVNSTMAAALVGAKLGIPVDHVEAGLRSFDRTMPEEINRIVTDTVATRFFASEPSGVRNLLKEGHPRRSIFHVGNVMIDTLKNLLPQARRIAFWRGLGLVRGAYGVVTLHRPSNVDRAAALRRIFELLRGVSERIPLVFPVHPRTRRRLGRLAQARSVRLLPPLPYPDFLSLLWGSRLVITDSGGIQEETTFLRIPCLTLRNSTERPITVRRGTNTLLGKDLHRLLPEVRRILKGSYKSGSVPELWDGRASERIARAMSGSAPRRVPKVRGSRRSRSRDRRRRGRARRS